MMITVAVISGEDIADKILFDEQTEQDALETAQKFLSDGHFGYCKGDAVRILPEEYVIGDYCFNGKYVKATYFAVLNDSGVVTDVTRKPSTGIAPEGLSANVDNRYNEVEVDQGSASHILGHKYEYGVFTPPPDPQTELENRIVTKLLEALVNR